MKFKKILVAAVCSASLFAAHAQNTPLKIGFITDMSSLYADIDGPAGAEVIKMARAFPVPGADASALAQAGDAQPSRSTT